MTNLSDNEITERYLTACATHIQWLIDEVRIEDNQLLINGWAIVTEGEPNNARFLLNGKEFDKVEYAMPSPDLEELFWNIPTAQNARFVCKTAIDEHTFSDGFARLEFLQDNRTQLARQTAWYLPNPNQNLPTPEEARIRRVIGAPDSTSYLIGGAAIFKRFEHYLEQKFSRSFKDFKTILDWGCGSGRVSRHFHVVPESEIWGVDIDKDNISWCQTHLPHGKFSDIPLTPPTPLPDDYFDLIIGISVLTHLNEENQFAWLQELKRIAKKGATLMLSIQGLSQAGLYRPPPAILREVEEKGFLITGRNSDLDDVMADNTHYINVIQSRDYIHKQWGKYFTILDIVDAMAANQDVVVMRNDKTS
jgi:2-polyprenyl-3-methyl-5-hydroxy-6-metoxy-1,4-benzoquinol methylase